MTAKIINGKEVASSIYRELSEEIKILKEGGIIPGLAVILVGEDPTSLVYVRQKERACEKLGILSKKYSLSKDVSEEELLKLIDDLNNDPSIHGILVQLPLPDHIDTQKVLNAVDPKKDVDGFHPFNVGNLTIGEIRYPPCTPHGVLELLMRTGVEIRGKNAVVVGRSNIVGKPMALMLLHNDATVTICHSKTRDLASHTRRADILVVAVGHPKLVTADMVKEGVVVIDVGINRVDDKLVGDVDYEAVKEKAAAITPVPGGVGPMTIGMLLKNTVEAAKIQSARK
ncbi:MAG: bifunctional methylenetetrahydrofolate dehydrogenase/methenyltetrahydrofolate cyclohydrolase FolD [Actinomycetota bacterium]|nr:bifunctional methylenetetrahydrofolate dehydrogenase/methenyltetrahydrofolate cyclohydrolase FolD [Actinomycetota bacterium]